MKDESINHDSKSDNTNIAISRENEVNKRNHKGTRKRRKRKKKKFKIIYELLIVTLLILVFAISFIILTYKMGFGSSFSLKYGNSNNQEKGVFITDVSKVVNKQISSMVAISCKINTSTAEYDSNYFENSTYSESSGTGIIISKTEQEVLILTNYHVIENSEEIRVHFVDGKDYIVNVRGFDSKKDIAILTIDLGSLNVKTLYSIKAMTIGNSNNIKVGNGVVVIGNSLGYGLSAKTGIISDLNKKIEVDNYEISLIQTDASINTGDSGGALLNSSGELIGIVSFKYSSSLSSNKNVEGIGFAIPILDITDTIEKLSK